MRIRPVVGHLLPEFDAGACRPLAGEVPLLDPVEERPVTLPRRRIKRGERRGSPASFQRSGQIAGLEQGFRLGEAHHGRGLRPAGRR
jgi:hypothetical protein